VTELDARTNSHTTWLDEAAAAERIDLGSGAWVDVVRGLMPLAQQVHDELAATVSWEQGRVFRYERWIDEPRLGSFQKGPDRHPALVEAELWIRRRYKVTFEGVALAHYRNERDSVAWHRDRELRWLEDTVIGVLSMGAQRPWLMRPLTGRRSDEDDDGADVIDLSPASGDLLVMGGRCQAAYLHSVPKLTGRVRSRISAQWRYTSRRGRRDPNPGYYAPRHFTR
jgi:alkylated DNA repair dioxygenase AlkB